MNFELVLSQGHNKAITNTVVNYIGNNPSTFGNFLEVFNSKNPLIIQRAAWPLGYLGELYPQIVIPHLTFILNKLDAPFHVAYKRNVFRFVRLMKQIPEEYHATIIDKCIENILNQNNPGAVRAFAIHIITKFAILYPELKHEVLPILENALLENIPAIQSSAKHALQKLNTKHKTNSND